MASPRRAAWSVKLPPDDEPNTQADPPAAMMMAARSSISHWTEYCAASPLSPRPLRSYVKTVKSDASNPARLASSARTPRAPLTRINGSPAPDLSNAIGVPSAEPTMFTICPPIAVCLLIHATAMPGYGACTAPERPLCLPPLSVTSSLNVARRRRLSKCPYGRYPEFPGAVPETRRTTGSSPADHRSLSRHGLQRLSIQESPASAGAPAGSPCLDVPRCHARLA